MAKWFRHFLLVSSICLSGVSAWAQGAKFEVLPKLIAPPAPPVAATIDIFGNGSRFMPGGGFEPMMYRTWFTVREDAPLDQPGRILSSYNALSQFDTLRSGAFDGAEISVLRLENGAFREVRSGSVPQGGHQIDQWVLAHRGGQIVPAQETEARVFLGHWERGGRARWVAIRAIDTNGNLSEFSEPVQVQIPQKIQRRNGGAERLPMEAFNFDADKEPGSVLAPPKGLVAQINATGDITLRWQAPARTRSLAGYAVYFMRSDPKLGRSLYLQTTGAGDAVKAGDLVIVRQHLAQHERSQFLSDRVWSAREAWPLRGAVTALWPDEDPQRRWELKEHPNDPSRNWGGRSYLSATLGRAARMDLHAYNHSHVGQKFYQVLEPGVVYRVSAWLRGDRPGKAYFYLAGPYRRSVPMQTFSYGTEWQKVTATFTVPEAATSQGPPGKMVFQITGPGRVDVDDLRVQRDDTLFQDFTEREYDRLRRSAISSLRTHGTARTGTYTYDLRGLLDLSGMARRGGQYPSLHRTLSMMQRAGVDPWLQIEPHFSDAEWQGLIEYLAAPFDPETDDPAERPWAALRVAQGQAAPWTDSFDRLYLELGNETWNGLFAPWVFPVMTDAGTGQRVSRGTVYGAFQERVAQVLRASPWWEPSKLEKKVQFVIGGRNWFDYGTEAARAAPNASDYLMVAGYNGGWDEDEGLPARTRASYFNVLNQVSQATIVNADRYANDIRDLLANRSKPLRLGTYEAGPGYVMNGLNGAKVSAQEALEQEQVMKSQSSGVATLDTFLAQRERGFGLQNYFMFDEGERWTSHARWYAGGVAHPSWDMLTLLNHFGKGALLEVETIEVPRADLAQVNRRIAVSGAPLVETYATGASDHVSLFVISRRVPFYPEPGEPGCTPVEIKLPFTSAERMVLFRTNGEYDTHTTAGQPLPIERIEIPVSELSSGVLTLTPETGAESCGLPAASAFVYVVQNPK